MEKKKSSISRQTESFQPGCIEEVTSSSASAHDPPVEEADGGIKEPIPTRERRSNKGVIEFMSCRG